MKHRLLVTLALAALACAVVAATALGGGKGRLYQFRGDVAAASSTAVTVTIEGGNHAALRALIGQSQNETFALGAKSEVLVWSNGVPHVGSAADLKPGDNVTVNVRAPRSDSLAQIEATASWRVADRGPFGRFPHRPLWLFIGTLDAPAADVSVRFRPEAVRFAMANTHEEMSEPPSLCTISDAEISPLVNNSWRATSVSFRSDIYETSLFLPSTLMILGSCLLISSSL